LNKGHDQSADFYALGIFIYELLTGNPPFNSADAMKVYRMALKGLESFSMPLDKISRCSATIIRHLAKEFPSERLGNGRNGVNDIRRHKWFQGFDWDGLAQGSLEAPYTPKIASATDLHNFDVFDDPEDEFLDCESPDDEGWDREF
jgi:cGMP-dependent protein kinase